MRSTFCLAFAPLLALLTTATAARAEVEVSVYAPANLADALDPMPKISIANNTKRAITLEVFENVPFTYLQQKRSTGFDGDDPSGAMCGGGFVPYTILPEQHVSFRLWSLLDHGPGVSGTFRAILPYTTTRNGKEISANAVSPAFQLSYGDISPPRWTSSMRPGSVASIGVKTAPVSTDGASTPVEQVLTSLLPSVQGCVARAQQRLPWLRGRFTLVVYHYPKDPRSTLYVDTTLLGDPAVNACLQSIASDNGWTGKYELTFAVTQPR